jgi:hypothetical protein
MILGKIKNVFTVLPRKYREERVSFFYHLVVPREKPVSFTSFFWIIIIKCKIWTKFLIRKFFFRIELMAPPIFIVGCGHSGTSLLLALLGAHSKIFAIPFESSYGRSTRENFLNKLFLRLTIGAGKTRWVEKTPRNIYSIEKIFMVNPGARVILVIRDGRDVAYSIKERTLSIEKGIHRWVDDNLAGESFWSHPQLFVVKYEDIINDRSNTLSAIFSFIGETFEPSVDQYYKKKSFIYSHKIEKPENAVGLQRHNLNRNWQINQPIFDGRGKWKNMTDDEKAIVKKIGGDMLIRYGYTVDNNW